jgi:uracil DNA glycosylase
LQTETQVSAVNDTVKQLLSEDACEKMNNTIRKAAAQKVEWANVKGRLKALHKSEQEKVKDLFEGQDTYNLPEGQSKWRLSNAVSWLATGLEDGERKLDLERVAGQLIA